jgi:hypothetical protein
MATKLLAVKVSSPAEGISLGSLRHFQRFHRLSCYLRGMHDDARLWLITILKTARFQQAAVLSGS